MSPKAVNLECETLGVYPLERVFWRKRKAVLSQLLRRGLLHWPDLAAPLSRSVGWPVEDDPARTMVMLRLLSPNTVEQTNKRDGKVLGVLRLTVAPDGKTIHATYENKENDTTTRSELRKQE